MLMRCIFCVLSSMMVAALMISMAHGEETLPTGEPGAQAPALQPLTPPPGQGAQASKKSKVVYKEKSYYDFEDVLINGSVRAPDGSFIFRKSDTPFSSALNMKRSFIPELKESAASAR